MKSVLICYESQYGYSQRYAQWMAEKLDCPTLPVAEVKNDDLRKADLVVAGGGLYAGKVGSAAFVKRHSSELEGKLAAFFTVGLAPVERQGDMEALLKKALPPQVQRNARFFFLRGGMDASRLKWVHRMMMKMLVEMTKKKAPDQRTEEDQGLIDSIGKAVDFSSPEAVLPLVDYIKGLR